MTMLHVFGFNLIFGDFTDMHFQFDSTDKYNVVYFIMYLSTLVFRLRRFLHRKLFKKNSKMPPSKVKTSQT